MSLESTPMPHTDVILEMPVQLPPVETTSYSPDVPASEPNPMERVYAEAPAIAGSVVQSFLETPPEHLRRRFGDVTPEDLATAVEKTVMQILEAEMRASLPRTSVEIPTSIYRETTLPVVEAVEDDAEPALYDLASKLTAIRKENAVFDGESDEARDSVAALVDMTPEEIAADPDGFRRNLVELRAQILANPDMDNSIRAGYLGAISNAHTAFGVPLPTGAGGFDDQVRTRAEEIRASGTASVVEPTAVTDVVAPLLTAADNLSGLAAQLSKATPVESVVSADEIPVTLDAEGNIVETDETGVGTFSQLATNDGASSAHAEYLDRDDNGFAESIAQFPHEGVDAAVAAGAIEEVTVNVGGVEQTRYKVTNPEEARRILYESLPKNPPIESPVEESGPVALKHKMEAAAAQMEQVSRTPEQQSRIEALKKTWEVKITRVAASVQEKFKQLYSGSSAERLVDRIVNVFEQKNLSSDKVSSLISEAEAIKRNTLADSVYLNTGIYDSGAIVDTEKGVSILLSGRPYGESQSVDIIVDASNKQLTKSIGDNLARSMDKPDFCITIPVQGQGNIVFKATELRAEMGRLAEQLGGQIAVAYSDEGLNDRRERLGLHRVDQTPPPVSPTPPPASRAAQLLELGKPVLDVDSFSPEERALYESIPVVPAPKRQEPLPERKVTSAVRAILVQNSTDNVVRSSASVPSVEKLPTATIDLKKEKIVSVGRANGSKTSGIPTANVELDQRFSGEIFTLTQTKKGLVVGAPTMATTNETTVSVRPASGEPISTLKGRPDLQVGARRVEGEAFVINRPGTYYVTLKTANNRSAYLRMDYDAGSGEVKIRKP